MSHNHKPQLLTVQRVLSDQIYSIPVYQRNYAWGVKEISQLIADVRDYAQRNVQNVVHDYYIGTLVVYGRSTEKQSCWEVVDGQQRLTTLSLLVSVLRAMHPELSVSMQRMPLQFECREASSQALQAVFAQPLKQPDPKQDGERHGSAEDASGARSIWEGRSIMEGLLREFPESERKTFADFLLHRVQLLRVELPPRTDLNHYFEVMNNRGEQLAKHEVLKARLMGRLQQSGQTEAMRVLHAVWDACAVMDRSVLSGFRPEMRKRLFRADGAVLLVKDKEELQQCLCAIEVPTAQPKSLQQLIAAGAKESLLGKKQAANASEDEEDESQAQFGAVINFPNFLLQVLAMMPGDVFANTPLDDKHLLTGFEPLLCSDAAQIQEFAYRLLRCRFLLDQHVIKSAEASVGDEEHWRLQRCKFKSADKASLQWVNAFEADAQDCAERLRMLQAALHVSYMLPTRKHWLQGVLRWLYRQEAAEAIEAPAFLSALEDLTKAFVLEVGCSQVTYEDIVRRVDACVKNQRADESSFKRGQQDAATVKDLFHKLTYGQTRLIDFNFLDYLLWLKAKSGSANTTHDWRTFEFTSTRRSVEHLHPQTALVAGSGWGDEHLHAFGNLCLVSHAMNSRLGNAGPEDKFKQLLSEKSSQSLKVFAMHSAFVAAGSVPDREKQAMLEHAEKMRKLMQKAFETDGLINLDIAQTEQKEAAL